MDFVSSLLLCKIGILMIIFFCEIELTITLLTLLYAPFCGMILRVSFYKQLKHILYNPLKKNLTNSSVSDSCSISGLALLDPLRIEAGP